MLGKINHIIGYVYVSNGSILTVHKTCQNYCKFNIFFID